MTNAAQDRRLRIGDVAKLVGTTTRTIRYYEEFGLLANVADRNHGRHRLYSDAEVERVREIMRLRNLLGVSLDELKTLLAAEDARAAVRAELRRDGVDPARRRQLLTEALGHVDQQLHLVDERSAELEKLQNELLDTRGRIGVRLSELEGPAAAAAVRVQPSSVSP